MQRWMLYAVLAVVGFVFLAGGAYFARKEYSASKPAPIWVPLALRADISMEEQGKLAAEIEERLRSGDFLRQAVVDSDLQAKFSMPTEDATVQELKNRLFVKVGTASTPAGTVPSINIGFKGTGREKDATGAAATRIMKDVWKMIGIDPETGRPLPRPGAEAPADSGFNTPAPDLN